MIVRSPTFSVLWSALHKTMKNMIEIKKTERSDKETVINGKIVHKYKRKKRYGHSIKNHAPGRFLLELKRKAEVMDIPYFEILTSAYKASQFHHDTGEYIPSRVNERYKVISNITVQRDLYSAFLIRHTLDTLNAPDIGRAIRKYAQCAEIRRSRLSAEPICDRAYARYQVHTSGAEYSVRQDCAIFICTAGIPRILFVGGCQYIGVEDFLLDESLIHS